VVGVEEAEGAAGRADREASKKRVLRYL